MKRFPYLRRPMKLLLYGFLLAVTTATALIFSLQAVLDGLSLQHAINSYAYVGTVFAADESNAMEKELPQEVVSLIADSQLIESVDIRKTYSAKLLDANTVPDFMMTTDQVQQHYFVDGTVIAEIKGAPQKGEVHYDMYSMRLNRQWGSSSMVQANFMLYYARGAEEEKLAEGQRLFLIGNYIIMNNGVNSTYMQVYTPQAMEIMGMMDAYADNPLMIYGAAMMPDGMNMPEAENWIRNYMAENGLDGIFELYRNLGNNVTVRTTSDFTMLPYYLKGRIYMDMGSPIYKAHEGKKVCLISQGLSLRNRLAVGDTITLALGDGSYSLRLDEDAAWENGFPAVGDETQIQYAEGEEYEIIGVYHQLSRDTSDSLFVSVNDIFIPDFGIDRGNVRPYAFSFRVTGPNYEAMTQQLQPRLEQMGYEMKIIDSDWDDVEQTFYAMLDRQRVMVCCAAAAFLVAVFLFAVLIHHYFRYEYGLMRLLGAYSREAIRQPLEGFLLTAVPALATAVLCSWAVYVHWLKDAASAAMNTALPSNEGCLLMLAGLAAAELMVGLFGLIVLNRTGERRGLLRLIK